MLQITWREARLLAAIVLILISGGAIKALRPLMIPQLMPRVGQAK